MRTHVLSKKYKNGFSIIAKKKKGGRHGLRKRGNKKKKCLLLSFASMLIFIYM